MQSATYVSVWDGSVAVCTNCKIDLDATPPRVTDVETADDSGDWTTLDEEYVELADDTRTMTFRHEDDYDVVDGEAIHNEDDDDVLAVTA